MTVNFYMMECYQPVENLDIGRLRRMPRLGTGSWRLGKRFTTPPEEPIRLEMMPNHPDELKELHKTHALVMTKRLLLALQEAGVDNLDVYECEIFHARTGFSTREYVAANLIGLVSAADLSNSTIVDGSPDHFIDTGFEGLTIDESNAKGLLMFRLAENTSGVVVHHNVKEHLESKGFDMLTFVDPGEWIH